MPDWAYAVGIGAAAVYAVGRDLIPYIIKKRNGVTASNGTASTIKTALVLEGLADALGKHFKEDTSTHMMIRDLHREHGQTADLLRDLHRWHDVRDEDQVPVWYIRKSLEKAITDLTESIRDLRTTIDENGSKQPPA